MGSNTALLEDYLELVTYGFTNPMPDSESGPWKVTAKDVINGKINFSTARKTTQEAFDSKITSKSRPLVGDVLLTKDGTLGRLAIVKETGICINQSVALLRTNEKLLPEYLYYLLSTDFYQKQMINNSDGSVIKHIYITRVGKMEVDIPCLTEQKRRLNILTSLDSRIELNEIANQTLEQMAQALFKSWFVDFDLVFDNSFASGTDVSDYPEELQHRAEQRKQAQKMPDFKPLPDNIRNLFPSEFEQTDEQNIGVFGRIPRGWEVKELSQLVNHQKGFAFKSAWYQDEGHIIVRVSDTTDDSINVNSCNKIPEELAVEYSSYALKENDLVIATVGSWPPNYSSVVGKVIRVPRTAEGGLLNQNAVKLTVSNEYSFHQGFLHCSLKNPKFMGYIVNRAQGSANQASITLKSIFNFPILLANNEVMRAFSDQIKINFDKQNLNYKQIQNLTRLRDSLLPKLIAGELDISSEEIKLEQAISLKD